MLALAIHQPIVARSHRKSIHSEIVSTTLRYLIPLKLTTIIKTMKVFLYYEDNENKDLHKTLKITLPKSWKTGPTSRLLTQFVESYNASPPQQLEHTLEESEMHLALQEGDDLVPIPSDATTQDAIPDRANVHVRHGPSMTQREIQAAKQQGEEDESTAAVAANMVTCTRFGCKNRFPKGGPYPEHCQHHVAPPVFHETAKFWSCCPTKKAYDWNDFEAIPGCKEEAYCTDVKDQGQKQFLGGMELRAQNNEGEQLRSIDDFNKARAAGGTTAAPILERLQRVMQEMGIEQELYNQVVEGMKKELEPTVTSEPELLEAVVAQLGAKLKATMKAIAVDQLRIK